MTTRCHTHTTTDTRSGLLNSPLGHSAVDQTPNQGFLPTTRVATPQGWQSISSILPGDVVLTQDGDQATVVEVRQTTTDLYDDFGEQEDRPIFIPSYALGNLSEFCVLPDQCFQIPETAMGVQHIATVGPATARDLVGLNGIRTVDPEDLLTAITLVFERETVISCAHGGMAVCPGRQSATKPIWQTLLTG